jgi:hypothetical protein
VSDAGRRVPRWAPWLLLAALLLLIASATWKLAIDSDRSRHGLPQVSDPDEPIAAYRAEAHGPNGEVVTFLVAPLHADPARQRFEASALAERLALDSGEPWRLVRRGPATDPGTAGTDELYAPLPPSGFSVRDGGGVALRSLEAPAAGGLVDPVRSAFAPWTSSDRSTTTCVLWGRPPGDGAVLGTGNGEAEVPLEASTVHRSELEVPLARLERPLQGKNPDAPASESQRGTPSHR